MKILFLGEYSNVHWTLAEGLRKLGHTVTVVSNGDFWKDYQRDIDLSRTFTTSGKFSFLWRLIKVLPKLKGYDIVQLINPMFLELKAERIKPIYDSLRRHNRKIILCAFGMDYYWVHACCTKKPLRYSDFNIGAQLRTNKDALKERKDWIGTAKERLNRYIATDCDGIVAGLYEYWISYKDALPHKTVYLPFPIKRVDRAIKTSGKFRLFIGINRDRSEYKGTDIMMKAANAIAEKYPERVSLHVAESVPFEKYSAMMEGCDAILDQLYSYTPSMNSLLAMSKGIICIGGGEPEGYDLIGENELRPIVNVQPCYESVYGELEKLVLHPERIPELRRRSMEYVSKHHDYMKVARQYEQYYQHVLEKKI